MLVIILFTLLWFIILYDFVIHSHESFVFQFWNKNLFTKIIFILFGVISLVSLSFSIVIISIIEINALINLGFINKKSIKNFIRDKKNHHIINNIYMLICYNNSIFIVLYYQIHLIIIFILKENLYEISSYNIMW